MSRRTHFLYLDSLLFLGVAVKHKQVMASFVLSGGVYQVLQLPRLYGVTAAATTVMCICLNVVFTISLKLSAVFSLVMLY